MCVNRLKMLDSICDVFLSFFKIRIKLMYISSLLNERYFEHNDVWHCALYEYDTFVLVLIRLHFSLTIISNGYCRF